MKKLVGRVPRAQAESEKMVVLDYPPFDVLLVFDQGRFYAIEDACNHAGASLAPGYVEDACIVCPVHGYKFSLQSGELLAPKGLCDSQRTFSVEESENEIVIWDTFSLVVLR